MKNKRNMPRYMEKREPKKPNHAKNAAAIVAAALAVGWILLELLLFALRLPFLPEKNGADFTETDISSGFSVTRESALWFKSGAGEIRNIRFEAVAKEEGKTPGVMTVRVMGRDAANPSVMILLREWKFAVGSQTAESTLVSVNLPANVGRFYLNFSHDGADYVVKNVTLNSAAVPFPWARVLIVLACIGVGYLCVRFRWWQLCFDPSQASHRLAAAALVFLCVLMAGILSSTFSAARGSVAYPLKGNIGYYNQYIQQFDAMQKGQNYIDYAPSEALKALDNPYDPLQREGVPYLYDRAFYQGRYYSYFGIAPILTVYYPYYFLTGALPAEDTVTSVFAVMTALFFSLAAVKWAAMREKRLPFPLLFLGTIGGLFASQVFLIMRGTGKVYYIATIAGMAFLSLFLWLFLCGLSGTVRLWHDEAKEKPWSRPLIYAGAGLAYGLCFLSRFNMALLAAFGILPLLWFGILTDRTGEPALAGEKRLSFRPVGKVLPELIALGIPVVLAIGFQLLFNQARFDSFFEFGTTYQLTVSDVSKNRLRLSDLPYAVFFYFLSPVSLTSGYPFVSLQYVTFGNYGHYVYVDTGLGLLAIPMMWSLFGSVGVFLSKKSRREDKILLGSLLVGLLAVAFFDFCLGGVIFRYTCDLTLLAAFAAMALLFSLGKYMVAEDGTVRRGLCFGVTGFLLISVLFCLSLGASLNANLTGYSPSLYVALRDLLLLH